MTITDSIKQILSISIKPRTDSYTDQYSRIFMVKLTMVGALLVGLNWYSDKITCIQPGALGISEVFVGQACWINGLYIYRDLRYRNDDVAYYGVPRDIRMDGMYEDGTLCATHDTSLRHNPSCIPMKKTFYLEFQYMTFVIAGLGIFYYAPYAFFRLVNQDMVSLKGSVAECNPDAIVKNYFNYKINPRGKLRLRVIGNLLIKLAYIICNVIAFVGTDIILGGTYRRYGLEWISWSKQPNEKMLDYIDAREGPKPGNYLLPSFGFCSLQEASQDIKFIITNKHKLVCEISQHILYQYVFIMFWFCMIFGIIISSGGFLWTVTNYIITIVSLVSHRKGRRLCRRLTLRECEYMEYIRRKNLILYGAVLHRLRGMKDGHNLNDII